MSVRVKVSLAALCLALAAGAVHAQTTAPSYQTVLKTKAAGPTITPTAGASVTAQVQNHDIAAVLAQSGHADTTATSSFTAQVMAALSPASAAPGQPATAGGTYAAGSAGPSTTPSAPVGSDAPAVTGADPKASTSILDLAPLNHLSGIATGMSTATRLPLPDDGALSHDTAQAIVRAFHATPGTADQAASDAADDATTGDPALDERIALARTVFKVDGTDDLIRHFISSQMMKVVITEVAKHIDINKLSETDKYHLSAVAAAAQTHLEDEVLNLDARVEATYLTKADLTQLVVAYDNDAQRKQTQLRLGDTGRSDRAAALDITMAQFQIVKTYESGQ